VAWLGPRPETIRNFALKHVARELAAKAGVPVCPGSDLMQSTEEAVAAAVAGEEDDAAASQGAEDEGI
jgi:urea carboxylase